MFYSSKPVTRVEVQASRGIAIIADVLQIVLFPMFVEGFISPLDDLLDIGVGIALCALIGPHIAFVPSFIIKTLPIADEAPTWTIAVLIATAGRRLLD